MRKDYSNKLFLFIVCFSLFFNGCTLNKTNNNDKEIMVEELSLVNTQALIEDSFKDASGYTIDKPNIILDPYNRNPLSALLIFESDLNVSATLTVLGDIPISNDIIIKDVNYIPILGLYSDCSNEVVLEYVYDDTIIEYKYIIDTKPLPNDIILPTSVEYDRDFYHDDIYILTPASNGYSIGFDLYGDIRFYSYHSQVASWHYKYNNNGYFIVGSDRLYSYPYYNTGFYLQDLLGKVYYEYNVVEGYHHDIYHLDNGNYLLATNDFINGYLEDVIVEIDYLTGEIVKRIDLKSILDIYQGKSAFWVENDWFHNNGICYDINTNTIMLSGRHQDIVLGIDYDSYDIKFIIGDKTNWDSKYHKYFLNKTHDDLEWIYSPHAPEVLPNSNIFIFDNGNNRSKISSEYIDPINNYSRGVIYDIDYDNMEITQVYQYGKELGSEFYSPYISDVDYIEDNHYIIHSGGRVYIDGVVQNYPAAYYDNPTLKSTTVEIIDDKEVFVLDMPYNYYNIQRVSLYSDNEYTIGLGTHFDHVIKTPIKEVLKDKIDDYKLDYDKYDIDVKLESDRLLVEGTFSNIDIVDIILYQDNRQYIYSMPLEDVNVSAMCIFIPGVNLSDDKSRVRKYINTSSNLVGSYDLYIKINNIYYNLNKSVNYDK